MRTLVSGTWPYDNTRVMMIKWGFLKGGLLKHDNTVVIMIKWGGSEGGSPDEADQAMLYSTITILYYYYTLLLLYITITILYYYYTLLLLYSTITILYYTTLYYTILYYAILLVEECPKEDLSHGLLPLSSEPVLCRHVRRPFSRRRRDLATRTILQYMKQEN